MENWVDSDVFDDLPELDLGTSYDIEQSAERSFVSLTVVPSHDLMNYLEIGQPVQNIERTPPHQPIYTISPNLSSRRNGEIEFFNTAGELTQRELQDLLYNYAGDSNQQNSDSLVIYNQNDIEDDNKDGILTTENSLAEYFKGALSSPGKLLVIRFS